MTTSSLGMIQVLKKNTVFATILVLLAAPVLVAGQTQDVQEPSTTGYQESTITPSGGATSTGSPIWGNSAASSIGSTSINPAATQDVQGQGTAPGAVNGVTGTGTGTTPRGTPRIRTGATADGRDPGGNPDVPFDSNMNLCFLLAGIVFSVWVMRKKYILKPAASNQ